MVGHLYGDNTMSISTINKISNTGSTTPTDRMFREVRRRANIIGCFENKSSLNKILFFVFDFINQLLGNASFNYILDFTQF